MAFACFLPFCFSGLRVSPVVMSSVNLLVALQLPSKNAADPKRKPLLSSILQEYALRRVFYQKTSLFLQLARGDGERETPKDLFPRSLLTKGSE